MPLPRSEQIYVIIFIAILIATATILRYAPVQNADKFSNLSSSPNQLYGVIELTDENFSAALASNSLLVVDFYYPGCRPCTLMNNTTNELSRELRGQIAFGKVNIKKNPEIAKRYKIHSYPTLLLFDEGVLINRIRGNTSKSDLFTELKDLKPHLNTTEIKFQPTAQAKTVVLAKMGEVKPTKPMLVVDSDIESAVQIYPYIVIDAFTTWCGACRALNTTLGELSAELQGQISFGLIDMEKNNQTKIKYNITSYPTLLIFKDGKLVNKLIGNRDKSVFVSELAKYDKALNTSKVQLTQSSIKAQTLTLPKQTPEQVCANMTKSDQPLLEAFVVSKCPFGLQMQRIMANIISKSPQTEDHLRVRYIGSVSNNTITSMHGDVEAQENLRQICIREEQSSKYWDYVECYMKAGNYSDCVKRASVDESKLDSCMKEGSRGLAYAQKDFDLADKFSITGSPTLIMNNAIVKESDFKTTTTASRSPEALKELLCCGFENEPSFCSRELNNTQATTMFEIKAPTSASAPRQSPGMDIPLAQPGLKKPTQAMLITDDTLKSSISQYPILVVEAYEDWCSFCKSFNVTVSGLARELEGQVAFGLIDMDKNKQTKIKYNITSYPTTLIFKDGNLVNRVIGDKPKSSLVAILKQIEPELNVDKVKIAHMEKAVPIARPTPEQVCGNMTKSDQPLLEAFVVSKCPFGLQMQRIMANIISKSSQTEDHMRVRYIGSVSNNTITSMHGDAEAQENLRQICIREEQSSRYWDYVECYMEAGNYSDCVKRASVDESKLDSCMKEGSRGLAYAQKDFDLADKFSITGSPTLIMNNAIVKESDFKTTTTASRSPEALKELLCCGFENEPSFCSLEFNRSRMPSMFSST
jgi:thioredoxin 1